MKESCAATCFQKIAFAHVEGFKYSRVEGDIKLPARQVGDIFCADVEGKGIAYMNWCLGKGVADPGIDTVYSVPGSNPKKALY